MSFPMREIPMSKSDYEGEFGSARLNFSTITLSSLIQQSESDPEYIEKAQSYILLHIIKIFNGGYIVHMPVNKDEPFVYVDDKYIEKNIKVSKTKHKTIKIVENGEEKTIKREIFNFRHWFFYEVDSHMPSHCRRWIDTEARYSKLKTS